MKHAHTVRMICLMAIAIAISLTKGMYSLSIAEAQTLPFLVSPHYGTTIISQGWSSPFEPNHHAYDFTLNYQPVLSAAEGTVAAVQWFNDACHSYNGTDPNIGLVCGFGLYMRVDHNNGYSTYYAHLSSSAFALTGGGATSVQASQIIANSGATGWTVGATPGTPGPHLHFELRNNNHSTQVDPFNPNLWKDGQWATPSRPIPEPVNGGEISIDDNPYNNGGFSKGQTGPFNNPCTGGGCQFWFPGSGHDGDMYYTYINVDTEDYWARWIPSLPSGGGVYEILVYVPDMGGGITTWQATYSVVHDTGTTKAVIDQEGARGRWVSIGTYRMQPGHYLYTTDATGETTGMHCGDQQYCRVGVDAVKFVRRGTTYTPDIRASNGYVSQITVRSNGGAARANISFFKENGSIACGPWPVFISAHALNSFSCLDGQVASAIIDGSQDLSISVATRRTDRAYAASGINPGGAGDPAVEHAATTLFAPAFYYNAWNYNSTLFIQNTGGATASGILYLVGRAGYPNGSCAFTIPPGGRIAQTPIGCVSSLPSPWVGSARIVSANQLIAAQALAEYPGSTDARSSVATATGQTVVHLPAAYKNKWNTNSGLVVQNVGGGSSRVKLTFFDRNTGNPTATYDFPGVVLAPGQAVGLWLPNLPASTLPDGWVGSIQVESLDNQPLAAIAQVADADDVYEYTGATGSFGSTVLLPRAARYDGGRTTGYIILNPSSQSVTVKRTYYHLAGNTAWKPPVDITLGPHQSVGYHQSGDTALASGWTGSILLQATGPIIAVMREDDTVAHSASSYNGLLR